MVEAQIAGRSKTLPITVADKNGQAITIRMARVSDREQVVSSLTDLTGSGTGIDDNLHQEFNRMVEDEDVLLVFAEDAETAEGLGIMVIVWSSPTETSCQSLRVSQAARGRGIASCLLDVAARIAPQRRGEQLSRSAVEPPHPQHRDQQVSTHISSMNVETLMPNASRKEALLEVEDEAPGLASPPPSPSPLPPPVVPASVQPASPSTPSPALGTSLAPPRHKLLAAFTLMTELIMAPEHRGQGGFTRAQTAQVLVNSLVIEIVVLCIFHSAPSEGPMVINPTAVVIGGLVAAAICIPAMLLVALLFEPLVFVMLGRQLFKGLLWLLVLLLFLVDCACFWPCDLYKRRVARTTQGELQRRERARAQVMQLVASAQHLRLPFRTTSSKFGIHSGAPSLEPEEEETGEGGIAGAGDVVRLVALVRDGNAPGKSFAALALANLSESNPANQAAIAAVGGITLLVALLRHANADGKRSAASALANLSDGNAANQAAIAAAGGIAPLVALAHNGDAPGKAIAAAALRDLACDNAANKAAIATAGGIEALVALVRKGDARGKAVAAEALAAIAAEMTAVEALTPSGAPEVEGDDECDEENWSAEPRLSTSALRRPADGGLADLDEDSLAAMAAQMAADAAQLASLLAALQPSPALTSPALNSPSSAVEGRGVGNTRLVGAQAVMLSAQAAMLSANMMAKRRSAPPKPSDPQRSSAMSSATYTERFPPAVPFPSTALEAALSPPASPPSILPGGALATPPPVMPHHRQLNPHTTFLQQRALAGRPSDPQRQLSHADLNEYMLGNSLTRSVASEDWPAVMRILFGWAANLLLFWSLLLLFTLYACELFSAAAIAGNQDASWQTLLLSWIFSILLRLVFNEHGLLVLSKGMRRSWQGCSAPTDVNGKS